MALWRTLGLGLAGGAVTYTLGMFGGLFGWYQIPGLLPIVATIGFSGWACQRVWIAGVAPVLHGSARWKTEMTRIPFWFMTGGMGTVIGILIAKKCGMLEIRDIPVKPLFIAGAKAFAGIQIALTLFTEAVMIRKRR
jgi:hypothetical protein